MTSKVSTFTFQRRQDSTSGYHCCVPRCSNSARFNSALSFFTFPGDALLRKKWIVKIRRDQFKVTSNTRVCSRHFEAEDMIQPTTPQGRRMLRKGAVPVLFDWTGYSLPAPRPGVWERTERPNPPRLDPEEDPELGVACSDHDYCSTTSEPAALDLALSKAAESQAQVEALQRRVEEMTISCRFGLQRFAGSDEDIRLYTRFSSYAHLMSFWSQIEPALPYMVRVTSSQAETSGQDVRHAFPTSLQPIDEFFLFMNYLALALVQKDLANRFFIHQSTVSRIITTWANFLYQVLGAIGIWLDEEAVQHYMPEVFSEYSDTQVILDCTELRCQTPDSLFLQSELYSSYKSHCTYKGLIGMAPHGAITFISPLYEGCVSDREILKQSGLVPLLKPSMAIMVDKGFLVEDLVPCKVHIPAFLKKQKQLSGAAVRKTQSIARLRGHVERVIRRVKEHKLFRTVLPSSSTGNINQLYVVACLLVNYENGPLVKAWASPFP